MKIYITSRPLCPSYDTIHLINGRILGLYVDGGCGCGCGCVRGGGWWLSLEFEAHSSSCSLGKLWHLNSGTGFSAVYIGASVSF